MLFLLCPTIYCEDNSFIDFETTLAPEERLQRNE